MLVSQFNFELPKELIATAPAKPRDAAKLLVVSKKFQDLSINDIPSFLNKDDIIVFNDTKVIPALLFGNRVKKNTSLADYNSANIKITLHKHEGDNIWSGFAKPARKLAIGDVFRISDEFYADIIAKKEGEVTLKFNISGEDFFCMLDKWGLPPLPPYIERKDKKPSQIDFDDYQTIYAKNKGAVAAPTAGLHFTNKLLDEIIKKGISIEFVTLHVGAGTFLPVKVDNTAEHIMHKEYGIISPHVAKKINMVKNNGGKVVAVGTTSLRLIESATDVNGVVHAFSGETGIFITPGYKFKAIDILLTNFHLPKSTLFMLVAAFCGLENIQAAYKHAIESKYRFYSYGDACLLFLSK